jgi:hypothetical protein
MRTLALYGVVLAAAAAQMAYFRDRLPPLVASHFDGRGVPNGFMTRDALFVFHAGLLLFLMLVFGGVGRLVRAVPPSLVNLPNREYWLAPERREESIAWLERELSGFGAFVCLFVVIVMQLVLATNVAAVEQGTLPRLPTAPIVSCVALVPVGTIVLLVRMYRRFGAPE